eukprot:3308453-Pleurochrysis_carterae.AAC.2
MERLATGPSRPPEALQKLQSRAAPSRTQMMQFGAHLHACAVVELDLCNVLSSELYAIGGLDL